MWLHAFPNLFITIAPAEWKFARPYFLHAYQKCVFAGSYVMSIHMYEVVRSIWRFLADRFGHRFFTVLEWVMKTEYQGRGTPHWHIAAWVVARMLHLLAGWSGGRKSEFVCFLEVVFQAQIDVQVGNGRLNYINGYIAKDHDALDVGMGEYSQKGHNAPWTAAFRLLSKSTPCIPEVALRMGQYSEFEKSYSHVLLYPPQPCHMLDLAGRRQNFSTKMYGTYLQEQRQLLRAGYLVGESFLIWHRPRQWDAVADEVVSRSTGPEATAGTGEEQGGSRTLVVACRYWYELTDGYWGQFAVTQLPHAHARELLPRDWLHLVSMQNFVGTLEYLYSWHWVDPGVVRAAVDTVFHVAALPLRIGDDGELLEVAPYRYGQRVFATVEHAYDYLVWLAEADLQYRGFRDDRVGSFRIKQQANFLLYRRVRASCDLHEYEMLRQSWDVVNRPKYAGKEWSPEQARALELVAAALSFDDEAARMMALAWLFVSGPPGSGKTALLIEMAVRAVRAGCRVLVVCPTGQNVHGIKAALPDVEGIENVHADTIQGILGYKRPGADARVRWSPPSALRYKELVLCDEASQYDDPEWMRLHQSIIEQPHKPYTVVVADFQQLQPVSGGGLCWEHCQAMQRVELQTVYRSRDEEHLLFLNRIRSVQPTRALLREYFAERHWSGSLTAWVGEGMRIVRESGRPFLWFTATNAGAAEVSRAALRYLGISDEELEEGYLCDPTSKSGLRILARRGIVVRLTRNLDKQRGFVNGAVGEVLESLHGNACFVVRLLGTGNFVLVHPVEEDGARFLPCCYGYATTIRRAQGMSVDQGCIYFDQKKHAAGRLGSRGQVV